MNQPEPVQLDALIQSARYVLRHVEINSWQIKRHLRCSYLQSRSLTEQLTAWRIVTPDKGRGVGHVVCVALRHELQLADALFEHGGVVPHPNPLLPLLLPPATARQRQVLQLMAHGEGIRQIAKQLYITENTVKTHIRHLYTLLGARHCGANVIHRAHLKGLLPPPHIPLPSGKDTHE